MNANKNAATNEVRRKERKKEWAHDRLARVIYGHCNVSTAYCIVYEAGSSISIYILANGL